MKAEYAGRRRNGEVLPCVPAVGTDNLTLGDRVKLIRSNLHWTQVELARRSGLSGTFISDVEANKAYPRSRSVAMLAEGLGTTTNFLVYGPASPITTLGETTKVAEPKVEPKPDDDIFQPLADILTGTADEPAKKKVRIQCYGDQLGSILCTIMPNYAEASHVNIEIERGEADSAIVLIEFTR